MSFLDFLLAGGLSVAVTFVLCRFADPIGYALGVIDYPDGPGGRKRHGRPTPLVGGLALLPALVLVLLVGEGVPASLSTGLPVLALIGFAVGFLDDRFRVGAGRRLLISLLAALVAVWSYPDLRLSALHFWFSGGEALAFAPGWAIVFTAVILVGLQNAVNMADGKNGLVPGLCLLWTAFLSAVAPAGLGLPLVVLACALGVVLVFNLQGRLFLGDGGSYMLSAVIGGLAIYCYNAAGGRLPAELFALWFWVPVADCLRLILLRLVRRRSPFDGDSAHFHHVIAAIMPWRYGLFVYLSLVALPGMIALMAPVLASALLIVSSMAYGLILAVAGISEPARQSRQGVR